MKKEITINEDLRSLNKYGTLSFPYMQCIDEINHYKNTCINWHWHDELEFIYVQKNSVICNLDGMSFNISTGNGFFINSGVMHSFSTEDDGVMGSFLFSPQLIAPPYTTIYKKYILPVLGSSCRFLLLKKSIAWQEKILSILKQNIEADNTIESCYEFDVFLSIITIWRIFYPNIGAILYPKSDHTIIQQQKRMQKMLEYIHLHYREPIRVDHISAAATVSKSEAQRCFHKLIHTTPNNYLIEYRLGEAHRLLLSSSKSISDIALDVGFESLSYFDRMYKKKYGASPKQIRKQNL